MPPHIKRLMSRWLELRDRLRYANAEDHSHPAVIAAEDAEADYVIAASIYDTAQTVLDEHILEG